RGRDHAGAGRRRPADDRNANGKHGQGGRAQAALRMRGRATAVMIGPSKRTKTLAMRSKSRLLTLFAAALLAAGGTAYGQSSAGHPRVLVTTNLGMFVMELD